MTDDPQWKIGDVVRTPASDYPVWAARVVKIDGQVITVQYDDGSTEEFEASALSAY
jgi:hypothetical protein